MKNHCLSAAIAALLLSTAPLGAQNTPRNITDTPAVLPVTTQQSDLFSDSDSWKEHPYTVEVGAGFLSAVDVCIYFFMPIVTSVRGIFNEIKYTKYELPCLHPNLSVYKAINSWLSLGLSISVGKGRYASYNYNNQLVFKEEFAYPSLLLVSNTKYLSQDGYTFYGHWGAGVTMLYGNHEKRNNDEIYSQSISMKGILMCNIYPICVSYGKRMGFLVALGSGDKGIVNVGCFANF